jgi:ATP-dependent Clp endopeptidase proteolytic subunit ClpP
MKKSPKAKNQRWLTVARMDGSAEIVISGNIGTSWYDDSGMSSREFNRELAQVPKGTPITLKINSPGGSIMDGLEIYNAIRERADDVTAVISGYAMSIASVIPLAAGRVVSPKSSVWMIHDPLLLTVGNVEEHKKSIEALEANADVMVDIYAERTGKSKEEIRSAMKAETYLTGTEAIEYGLADDNGDEEDEDASAQAINDDELMAQAVAAFTVFKRHQVKQFSASLKAGGDINKNAGTAASPVTIPVKIEVETVMKDEKKTEAAANPSATTTATATDTSTLAAAVERERKARITGEVTRRAEGKIKNDQLPWWIDQAMDNEEATFAQLDALPVARPGGEPLNKDNSATEGRIPIYEVPVARGCAPRANKRLEFMAEYRKLKTPGERVAAMKSDWQGMLNHCIERDIKDAGGNLPVAANTYSSTLITDFLVDTAITKLQNRWAALECFTRDFSTDRYKPLATGQVKLVTAGSSALTGTKSSQITNFEQNTSTTSPISVSVNHYSVPFGVTQDDLNSGLRLENLADINLAVLADTILKNCVSNIATSTFTAGTYYATAGTFGWTNEMPDLRSYLKKSPIKNILLDGNFMSRLINQPGFFQSTFAAGRASDRVATFGWDNLQENTAWTGAPTNIGGFFCNPQAICALAGLPLTPPSIPGQTLQESTIMIPGPDITIAVYMWFSLASRTLFCSYDVMFGSAAGDVTAGGVLYSGGGPRS